MTWFAWTLVGLAAICGLSGIISARSSRRLRRDVDAALADLENRIASMQRRMKP